MSLPRWIIIASGPYRTIYARSYCEVASPIAAPQTGGSEVERRVLVICGSLQLDIFIKISMPDTDASLINGLNVYRNVKRGFIIGRWPVEDDRCRNIEVIIDSRREVSLRLI